MLKDVGAMLIMIGIILVVVGAVFYFAGHTGIKMPLDIVIKGKNFVFYFPIGTCILLSILLTLVLSLLFKSK